MKYLLAAIFAFVAINAQAAIDVETLIKKVDELYRSKTSESEVEMRIETENWKRTLKMYMWTRGMKETFITIQAPKKDKGISTLRKDREMWNYFPKINKVVKVPPSMMMGSWMGSDFTNDDLVKETTLLDDYNAKLAPAPPKEQHLYFIELIPKKHTASVWGKIVVKIRKKDLIPTEEIYFDEKGNKMRIMTLKKVRNFSARKIPAIIEMIPLNKENHKTVIEYKEMRFDHLIKSNIFTLRNLQKKR